LNPSEIRKKIMENKEFARKIIAYLEGCHSGDFKTAPMEKVAQTVA
jgi:hypothetical protein